MGTVYLGEHTLLGRRAAIKVLLPLLSANEDIVRRFFNEARAVTRIADPGIVQIFDFGHHTDGSAFIVMELLEGEAMDRRLARIGRFGLVECLRLMRLVCSSLGVAHARGIVHRDLKPENIFIVADPAVPGGERAKILDFGIAKLADDPGKAKTRTGLLMGTPMYMSPEQCRGASDVDHRSDIYAMACVMFTMLTGRPPFDGEPGELIAAHLREPPPLASSFVPGLPGVVDQILQQCLRKAVAERFPSMAELVQAIGFAEQTAYQASAEAASTGGFARSGLLPQQLPSAPVRRPETGPGTAFLPAATTLSSASGHAGAPIPTGIGGPSRLRWLAALGGGAAVVGGMVVFAVVRTGGASSPASVLAAPGSGGVVESRGSATAGSGIIGDGHAPATIDAGAAVAPSATGSPEAAAHAVEAPISTIAVDAGVADAPSIAAAVDAAAPSPASPVVSKTGRQQPRQPSKGGDHGKSTGSAATPGFDRGD